MMMGYSLKEGGCNNKKMGVTSANDEDNNNTKGTTTAGEKCCRIRASEGGDRNVSSHGFTIKAADLKDQVVEQSSRLKPSPSSVSGSSISSMNVISNDTCKLGDHHQDDAATTAKSPSEARVASSQSLLRDEELDEGRQEPSPRPLSSNNHSSSSSFNVLHVSSNNNNIIINNREKASPLPNQLVDDAQTTVPKHHFHAGRPSSVGFRPPPSHSSGYHRPVPPHHYLYQQSYRHDDAHFHHHHHPPYMTGGGPPPACHQPYYNGYSTPHHRQRYPPQVHHLTPPRPPPPSGSVGAKEGVGKYDTKPSIVGSSLVKREDRVSSTPTTTTTTSLGKKESKQSEALPLKKRKLIDYSSGKSDDGGGECVDAIKTISVDDHETDDDKINESSNGDFYGHDVVGEEHRSWEEEEEQQQHYAHYVTPRYSGLPPYPAAPYQNNNNYGGHYYSPYHPSESDYNSPPRSLYGRRHHHYVQRQPTHEREHHRYHLHHLPVSPTDEECGRSNNDEPNQTMAAAESAAHEYSSRMDKLATAADTLEIRSEETCAKAEEDEGGEDGGDEVMSAKGANHKKCVPICSSLLTKFLQKSEKKDLLPAFAEIVNFPQYLPEKGSPSKKSNGKNNSPKKELSEKPCVMCGMTCIFAGTTPSRLHTQKKQSIIPKQNKGLCNSCDGKTWLFSDIDAAIKWCKGCKNFRLLPSFGEKYRATKCVRCRERQRDNYAELKRKRDSKNEMANLLVQQKTGWGSASDESERGSPELDAALGLASLC